MVWILVEISRKFPECVVEVTDDDGQFLLIEAAESIPEWICPDNSDRRVYLHRGNLHIIPLSVSPATPSAEASGHALIRIGSNWPDTTARQWRALLLAALYMRPRMPATH